MKSATTLYLPNRGRRVAFGSSIGRVPANDTAFAHRKSVANMFRLDANVKPTV